MFPYFSALDKEISLKVSFVIETGKIFLLQIVCDLMTNSPISLHRWFFYLLLLESKEWAVRAGESVKGGVRKKGTNAGISQK